MNHQHLIILSAPSGAGKTTLSEKLMGDFPEIKPSISSTTRTPRPHEIHGTHYFFLSKEDFQKKIETHSFAEWAHVHGHYYGTSKDYLDQTLLDGRFLLLAIDVQGAKSLAKHYSEECLKIFIHPPSLDVLKERLLLRKTETEESLSVRLKNAEAEMKESSFFDYEIVNDSLETAYVILKDIIKHHTGLKAGPGAGFQAP